MQRELGLQTRLLAHKMRYLGPDTRIPRWRMNIAYGGYA
jgi:hypothetical protein